MKPLDPRFVATWALLLAAAPCQSGLTPLQVQKLRTVIGVYPSPSGDALAFTRTSPRLASDGPGSAYVHLYVLEQEGIDRKVVERVVLGDKSRVRGVAWDPLSGRITHVHKGQDDDHPEVYAIAKTGGGLERITKTPRGISSYKWSPDGSQIAFSLADPLPAHRDEARELGFRQRIVDEDFRHISLWVWDRSTGKSRRLTEGRSVFSYQWSLDGSTLAAGIAPRSLVDDSYMFTRLHVVDVATGDVQPLVNNPGKLGAYAWSRDGTRLAYISAADRRDPHAGMLWVVDRRGGEARCLTLDLRGMVHDPRWGTNGAGDEVLHAVISRGVASHLATIDPQTGEITDERNPCDAAPAFTSTHGARGKPARFFAGSTATHPAEVWGSGFGPGYKRLTNSNPWLEDVALGKQEVVTVRARDGLQIEGLLLYPVGYESGERYPMVIVAHGGPESHFSNGWNTAYSRWGQMLCGRGYFAWYPNYRASTGYGVEFVKADHGDPMGGEFRDHLDAIAQFDAQGLIDTERVGIGGGSYGGYTAAWAATRHSERFAAAVSFVPFVHIRTKWYTSDIPNEFYLVHYEEKWPHEQTGFLDDRSPLTFADRCDTPLLLLGGTSDPRVHPSQPFMLYRAVKFATDTPTRYVQYPGEGHGNRSNVYQYDYAVRTLRWFDHYLRKGDHRDDAPPPYDVDYGAWLGENK